MIDLAGIDKVPIALLASTKDSVCPYARVVELADILGDTVSHFETIEGVSHGYFGSTNSEWYVNLIIS